MAAGVVILDQAAKGWALATLTEGRPVLIVNGFLALTLSTNTGLTFGLLSGLPAILVWTLAATALVACVGIGRAAQLLRAPLTTDVAVGLVVGGGTANLLDRLRLGAIVDFLDLRWGGWHWPTFNGADSAIAVGVLLLALALRRALPEGSTDPGRAPRS
jgi:signal peptidase II